MKLQLSSLIERHPLQRLFFLPFFIYFAFYTALYFLLKLSVEEQKFFSLQLSLSRGLTNVIFIHLGLIVIFFRGRVSNILRSFFYEPVSAYSLAIFRIGFFGLINGLYWYQFQNAGVLALGEPTIVPPPFTSWYAHLLSFDYNFYKAAYLFGIAVAVLSTIGLGYRYIAWLNILFCFYLIGLPMFLGKLFFMQLWFWGSCIMAFAPAADMLSVDALISKARGVYRLKTPHHKYGIPLKFIWLHLGVIYFFSAIWKLKDTGLYWALGKSMINQMQVEWLTNYYLIPSFRLDKYPLLAHGGGLFIIIIELVFVFMLFQKSLRWVAVLGGLSIHWGATYFLHLSMGDLQFMYLSIIVVLLLPEKTERNVAEDRIEQNISGGLVLLIGSVLLVVNSIFGFFNTASWPFSAYPSHSANIPATFTRIEFEIPELGLTRQCIDSIGEKNLFRKDNYYTLSDEAIYAHRRGDSPAAVKNISILWRNWQNNNPELLQFDKPQVFIIETHVAPERRSEIIFLQKIDY